MYITKIKGFIAVGDFMLIDDTHILCRRPKVVSKHALIN